MRTRHLRIAAALIGAALLIPVSAGTPSVAKGGGRRPTKYVDLKTVPKPKISGAEMIAGLEELVGRFPIRNNSVPGPVGTGIPMAEFLAKEAKKNGFKVKIIEYEVGGVRPRTVRVVQALKEGTKKPEEWIAFVSHFDLVPQTVQGAYDDTSGTNMMRFFGKAFKKIETKRTIALLWMDAEEDGLLASQMYAEEMKKEKQEFLAVLGFDMVGIGYPAPYCICIYHGPTPEDAAIALPILDYVNFDFLKFPEGDGSPGAANKWPVGGPPHVCSCGFNIRTRMSRTSPSRATSRSAGPVCAPHPTTPAITSRGTPSRAWSGSRGAGRTSRPAPRTPSTRPGTRGWSSTTSRVLPWKTIKPQSSSVSVRKLATTSSS